MASTSIVGTALLHPWRHRRSAASAALPAAAPPAPAAPLGPGERALIRTAAGATRALATQRALYVDGGSGADGWQRLCWESIASVGWSAARRELTLRTWLADVGTAGARIVADAGFAAFVAERVAATQLLVTDARLPDGTPVTVAAVRPASSDDVRWHVLLRGRRADETTLAHCRALIADVRRSAGC